MHTTLAQLNEYGQSIWYDNISRDLISGGGLEKLRELGLRGVTSNPTIFDKAISGSNDYDPQIREVLAGNPAAETGDLVRSLMVRDIQMAADILEPVYEATEGKDGFVSVEVTPSKARDTQATIAEVRELWAAVNRKNVMIKIPATREGLPAIEQSIAEGYNINVTLIFSVERYREVATAYIKGLERRSSNGRTTNHVASVASIFVSRIDTLVDDLLQKKIAAATNAAAANRLQGLLGKAAVANAKMVYQAFKELFFGPPFASAAARGAAMQRPLWASTGTKNPGYSDLHYVDSLIGSHTVNTVPPITFEAILDHSRPAPTVESDLSGARAVLRDLLAAGIDMVAVMKKLEDDGVAAFEKSFDALYNSLAAKRSRLASGISV
ncbi:MAG: transaldolase [Bacteroidota bacterium]